MSDMYKDYWNTAPNDGELLREIANDPMTPKNNKKKNTDGLFEAEESESQMLTED
jgi:hypothetical protein